MRGKCQWEPPVDHGTDFGGSYNWIVIPLDVRTTSQCFPPSLFGENGRPWCASTEKSRFASTPQRMRSARQRLRATVFNELPQKIAAPSLTWPWRGPRHSSCGHLLSLEPWMEFANIMQETEHSQTRQAFMRQRFSSRALQTSMDDRHGYYGFEACGDISAVMGKVMEIFCGPVSLCPWSATYSFFRFHYHFFLARPSAAAREIRANRMKNSR